MSDLKFWHPTCGARWNGQLTAHCSRCHETFSGSRAFDLHQDGKRCLKPAKAKLMLSERAGYQVWTEPIEDQGVNDT